MPRSYQPESRILTSSPLVRSTVGPQAVAETSAAIRSSRRTGARMRAILEHPRLNPLEHFVARDAPGQKIAEVRSAEPDDPRARAAVGRRQTRPVVVASRGNRQPFV